MVWKRYKNTYYEVSDFGHIRSIEHTIIRSNNSPHLCRLKTLKPATDSKGYLRVGMSINGKLNIFKVHRLVGECFVDNPNNLPQINHKDGIKSNNYPSNLEWCTNRENIIHAYKFGLINIKFGENHHRSVINEEIILKSKELRLQGLSFKTIASKFSVNRSTISRALNGITYQRKSTVRT